MDLSQLYIDVIKHRIADNSQYLRWDFRAPPLKTGCLIVITSPSIEMSLDYLRHIALDNANCGRTVRCDFSSEAPHITSQKLLNSIHGTTDWHHPPVFKLPGDITFESGSTSDIILIQRDAVPESLDLQLRNWAKQARDSKQTKVVALPTPIQDTWRAIPDAVINLVPSDGGIVNAWLNTKSAKLEKTEFVYWYQSWLGRFVAASEVIVPMDLASEQREYWNETIERALAEEVLSFTDIHRSEIFGACLNPVFLAQCEITIAQTKCDAQISDVEPLLEETLYAEVSICLSHGSKQFHQVFEGNIVVLIDEPGLVKIVSIEDLLNEGVSNVIQ